MSVHVISYEGIGSLPGSYPVRVATGGTVRASRARFRYAGPAITLYVCWGLKKGSGDFNSGENLEDGKFAYASVSVPASVGEIQTFDIVADLRITSAMRTGRRYDTYVWVATRASANEAYILVIDTDAGVVEIISSAPEAPIVTELEILYVGLS